MRILLVGQKSFGQAVLQMLLDQGRHMVGVWSPITDPLTRQAAARDIWVPPTERTWRHVKAADTDLLVTAHSHDFIPQSILDATRLGGVGYHPSLLPRHRGRDSVKWTIKCRDPIAGGSVYWLTDELDAGPIAAQDWCFVRPEWDASDLWRERLFSIGLRLLARVLRDIDGERVMKRPQDDSLATWAPPKEPVDVHDQT